MFPVNTFGVVWVVPIPEYGWEDAPAGTAGIADACPAPVGTPAQGTSSKRAVETENATTSEPVGRRLVITGYRYETQVQFIPFDSPLARPWQRPLKEEAELREPEPRPELTPEEKAALK